MLSSALEHTGNGFGIYTVRSIDRCILQVHIVLGVWSPVSETQPSAHAVGRALDKLIAAQEVFSRALQDTPVVAHDFAVGCLGFVLAWSWFVVE